MKKRGLREVNGRRWPFKLRFALTAMPTPPRERRNLLDSADQDRDSEWRGRGGRTGTQA